MEFLRLIYVITCTSSSFLSWLNNVSLYAYTSFSLPVYQLLDIWLVFHFLLIMNYAPVHICIKVSVSACVFISLKYIHSRRLLHCISSVRSLSPVLLCGPMNRSTPGLPVHHQLPDLTQIHVHQVGDAIQPSHPLSSPSSPTFNLSQHRDLFQ